MMTTKLPEQTIYAIATGADCVLFWTLEEFFGRQEAARMVRAVQIDRKYHRPRCVEKKRR